MYDNKVIVAIVPARAGSKDIKGKNIKYLAGYPLIYYTIRTASRSKYIDKLIVSTDNQVTKQISEKYGAEVPFMRPENLAGDEVLDLPVFQHALNYLEEKTNFKSHVTLNLRPTNPFRTPEDIDSAIKFFFEKKADSVKTLSKATQHPFRMWTLEKNGKILPLKGTKDRVVSGSDARRQDLPIIYWQNEYVDVCKSENIIKNNDMFGSNRYGYVIDRDIAIDLNTEEDFKIAEILLEKGIIKL
tara:strand:- start:1053 stop:1781 length:729 start_codon:yes stop_codon:yes gene_type:complete